MSRIILRMIFVLMLTAACTGVFAQADSLDFPAPQYMLPMYDHFSRNYLNAESMGRGGTGTALAGGVENVLSNPAVLNKRKSAFWMEIAIKPPIREINKSDDEGYTAPVPFGIIGLNGTLYKGLQGAISYNMPKSILYDNFTVEINQGNGEVVRYPLYYQHQFTATLAGMLGRFSLGLNLHNQLHQFGDIVVFQTFDRIDKTYYVFRIQPGLLYSSDNLNLGLTLTPEASRKMDIKYEVYDVTLPTCISAGGAYQFGNNRISLDADWEQFSRMSERFDDRLTVKAGYEKRIRNFTYRAGLSSVPGVYSGAYRLPVNDTAEGEQELWWSVIDRGGIIGDTDQLSLTAGFTYHFKGGKLVLGAMRDVLDNVPTTRVEMALGVNLETFKGKKFLIFEQ